MLRLDLIIPRNHCQGCSGTAEPGRHRKPDYAHPGLLPFKDKRDFYDLITEAVIAEINPSCGLSNAEKYLMETAGLYR
jgi:hypothetical protein